MNKFRFFLAVQSSTCTRKIDNDKICNGKGKLRRVIKNMDEEYIIGCDKWIRGEKCHRYTKVPEDVNLELLRNLFQGRGVCIYCFKFNKY